MPTMLSMLSWSLTYYRQLSPRQFAGTQDLALAWTVLDQPQVNLDLPRDFRLGVTPHPSVTFYDVDNFGNYLLKEACATARKNCD